MFIFPTKTFLAALCSFLLSFQWPLLYKAIGQRQLNNLKVMKKNSSVITTRVAVHPLWNFSTESFERFWLFGQTCRGPELTRFFFHLADIGLSVYHFRKNCDYFINRNRIKKHKFENFEKTEELFIMPDSCIACGNKRTKGGLIFFQFPKDPIRRTEWEQKMGRGWKSSKYSFLCEVRNNIFRNF
ncbi:unnamed protein product [Phaedon cochleariae]|uniref:THAP-type domain-containing protein n=1 Tax=Phaedon cochleariae TaxID=80249 RepID=A0A9N9SEZ5_PHACE|nr:unnamed protein product [Phaedon cochleariae]